MPLDAAVICRPRTLKDIADDLGIIGIDPTLLHAHKAAELAKAPLPSFAYRNQPVYEVTVTFGILFSLVVFLGSTMMMVGSVIEAARYLSPLMLIVAIGFCGTAIGSMSLLKLVLRTAVGTVRGPARWSEAPLPIRSLDQTCPTELADLARTVMAAASHGHLTLYCGELRQDTVLLDPYLLVRDIFTDDELILGVWKDDEILYLAG
jgi:hypothetical protein